jgi:uncharacterized protein (TIGR02996 family)
MNSVDTLLAALARQPEDDLGWLALADALDEQGETTKADMTRQQQTLRRDPKNHAARERMLELWQAGDVAVLPRLEGPAGLTLVLVPPGRFAMGAQDRDSWQDNDEQPRHWVQLTRGYYLGTTPVTRGQWRAIMGAPRGVEQSDDHPVESINWREANRFCERLGLELGRRCRLPTEAEWEYACRAGTTTLYPTGDSRADLEAIGWCSYSGLWDAAGGTRAVGTLRPNPFGIYDMNGNVWEWCADLYDESYYMSSPEKDPGGPIRGRQHVVRGGSWRGGPWFCRSSERRALAPTAREINIGFRVVVEVEGVADRSVDEEI